MSGIIHCGVIFPVVCLTTDPQPLSKRVLHGMGSSASFFKCQYPFFALRSSSSCLPLLPRLLVTYPSLYLSCSNAFLKAVHTQDVTNSVSLFFIIYKIFLYPLTLCYSSFLTRSVHIIFSMFQRHRISELPRYIWFTIRCVQVLAPYKIYGSNCGILLFSIVISIKKVWFNGAAIGVRISRRIN